MPNPIRILELRATIDSLLLTEALDEDGRGRDLGVWHATTTMLEGLSPFCGEALDRADHLVTLARLQLPDLAAWRPRGTLQRRVKRKRLCEAFSRADINHRTLTQHWSD